MLEICSLYFRIVGIYPIVIIENRGPTIKYLWTCFICKLVELSVSVSRTHVYGDSNI